MFKNLFVEDVEIFHGNEMSDFCFCKYITKGKTNNARVQV